MKCPSEVEILDFNSNFLTHRNWPVSVKSALLDWHFFNEHFFARKQIKFDNVITYSIRQFFIQGNIIRYVMMSSILRTYVQIIHTYIYFICNLVFIVDLFVKSAIFLLRSF